MAVALTHSFRGLLCYGMSRQSCQAVLHKAVEQTDY